MSKRLEKRLLELQVKLQLSDYRRVAQMCTGVNLSPKPFKTSFSAKAGNSSHRAAAASQEAAAPH